MADITRRTANRAARLLEPGEAVLVAILVEPKGTYGAGGLASMVAFGRLGRRRLERRAQEELRATGGLAAQFPHRPFVLGVTDRRVVAIESNGVQMKALSATFGLDQVTVVGEDAHGLGRRLTLACSDGTGLVLDCQRGQPLRRLTELLAPRDPLGGAPDAAPVAGSEA